MPWCRAWPETLSSIARGRACTRTPRRLASFTSSATRGLCAPCSTSNSRTRDGSLASAPSTGLMPTIQVSLMVKPHQPDRHSARRAGTIRNPLSPRDQKQIPGSARRDGRQPRNDDQSSSAPTLFVACDAFPLVASRHHPEIDLAVFHARAQHLHTYLVAKAKNGARALATQFMPARVELVIVVAQLGDVHQAGYFRFGQLHEQAERGDAGDDAIEFGTDVLFHPRALVALVHVALGFLGATLRARTVRGHRRHLAFGVEVCGRLAAGERIANRPVHEQIGIAPN